MNDLFLLGTKGGPAVRTGGSMPTSSLLRIADQVIVIDCGIGVTRAIVNAGVTLMDVDAIFITHLHSDHILELGPLLHTAWTTGLKRKIQVFGPVGTNDYLDHFLQSMTFDNDIRVRDEGRIPLDTLIEVSIFTQGSLPDIGGINVDALRVDHPPVTDCFALRFEADDIRVVFSADTAYFPSLAEFARNADVLVHEAMLLEAVDALVARTGNADRLKQHLLASHTAAADVARIARDANVKHLCLNHLIPADDPQYSPADFIAQIKTVWNGEVTVGYDGCRIDLAPD
ncbi:MBL fold metallo-hydrolase [Parasulfitobacter algicola]|uniref:MBL fold metallo-hydrolase n=1 Tax=Parasulfitobacter algicola TaxID=2614809 RepID=A0ABX2IR41_9RHOB|nr:MBL fold metallo-hydrolase [Sulfitobacter algicola]NSX55354.1 MBL fold metallo-hydrolase [Sulfitobacter algicola]